MSLLDAFGDPLPDLATVRLGTLRLRHGWVVHSIAFGPNGQWLVSGGSTDDVYFWDCNTGREIASIRAEQSSCDVPRNEAASVAVSPNGELVGAAGLDHCIYLISVSNRAVICNLVKAGMTSIKSLAFSPDGELLAASGLGGGVFIWKPANAKFVKKLPARAGNSSKLIAFASDGTLVVTVENELQFWNVRTGNRERTVHYKHTIESMDVSQDGTVVACLIWPKRTIVLTSLGSEEEQRLASDIDLNSVRFIPQTRTVVGAGAQVRVWDLGAGKVPREIEEIGCGCATHGTLAFSPDGKIMATHLRLWDTQTFKKKFYFSAHDATVRAVRFLSRARLITAGEDATFRIWNQESGEQVREIAPDKECTWLDLMAISPNGDQVAWAHGTDRLHLFDVARSQDVFRVREREGDKAITCVLFSPDGRLLATGGRDYRIDLWQSATGKKQHTLVGHSDDITCLAFFSSGQTLVSGSFDKTIRCWDLTVGTELQSIGQHEERISALAVSPDGRLVASGS